MEYLFSYDTLQLEKVQLNLFKRILNGDKDVLSGYKIETISISDKSVRKLSGESIHKIISYTGNEADRVEGTVYSITYDELLHSDKYEVSDYKRVQVKLISGKVVWVYVLKE
jgi:hypothetical protein